MPSTNVHGTLNVLRRDPNGRRRGVSDHLDGQGSGPVTDKAADPVNVLGYSKRLTERLTAGFARQCRGTFVSVRFGNVLGSRGSVLTAFAAQIAAGGPVTVTHPEVTRFFMTIPEAVQLTLQAASLGGDGETLVLDMGEPIRIADVAEQMIGMSGRTGVSVVFTGLREGEKLHEDLFGSDEDDHRPRHPLISHVRVPVLHARDLHGVQPTLVDSHAFARIATMSAVEATG